MRRDWDERAAQNGEHYVYTRDSSSDESDFEASGRVNYDQLVRPYLPVLLNGRSPTSCRVVEIGCGLGRITRSFAEEFLEVHGIDVSPRMIEQARSRLRDYPNVILHVGSGKDLGSLPHSYFDVAFSYLVFQHIPSREVIENYIREAARVLKPEGAFRFQLQGYLSPEYRRQEKDTWLGESFSLAEATQMLAAAGFLPLDATGVGTQYFMLTARKIPEEGRPLAPHIYAGQVWVRGQLLEGWKDMDASGGWPIEPISRAILAAPAAPQLRVFLSLYLPPVEPFPTLTLKASLNKVPLGSASLGRAGDPYLEWTVPPGAVTDSRAVLALEFHPPEKSALPRVRALGIYAPSEAEQQGEDPGAVTFRRLQREHQEAVAWARGLEAHAREALAKLQGELEERTAWALRLQAELEERTAWAQRLDAEREAAHADLSLLFGSRWYRLGKKLRLSPVPPSDQGRGGDA